MLPVVAPGFEKPELIERPALPAAHTQNLLDAHRAIVVAAMSEPVGGVQQRPSRPPHTARRRALDHVVAAIALDNDGLDNGNRHGAGCQPLDEARRTGGSGRTPSL